MTKRFEDFIPRMSTVGVLSACLLVAIYNLAPQDMGVILLKFTELATAGFGGYWLDRGLFPYARPHEFAGNTETEKLLAAAMLRRAIIVGACLVAFAVAL